MLQLFKSEGFTRSVLGLASTASGVWLFKRKMCEQRTWTVLSSRLLMMPVDSVEASSGHAPGDGVRIQSFSMNAQQNRTLMNSLQLCNTAIFAFGNDAAIRSEAEASSSCYAPASGKPRSSVSHRIREYEQRVSEEFNVELAFAEAELMTKDMKSARSQKSLWDRCPQPVPVCQGKAESICHY